MPAARCQNHLPIAARHNVLSAGGARLPRLRAVNEPRLIRSMISASITGSEGRIAKLSTRSLRSSVLASACRQLLPPQRTVILRAPN